LPSPEESMADVARKVEQALDLLLPQPAGGEARLYEAMRYAALGGGKRLRPFLVFASSGLFGVGERSAIRVGAAVELVHAYSLVHDDLPAMDNAELRRGKPACHKAFGEAVAILAGDALLTLAFESLTDPLTHSNPAVREALLRDLAIAAGGAGMVGGQMLDLEAEHRTLDIGQITRLQRNKTGALIAFSCVSGATLGNAGPPARHALEAYAHDLGLAFQITDDLLDAEGSSAETGKNVRQDAKHGKATFVSLLGRDRAHAQAEMLAEQAVRHLDLFQEKAELLRGLARFIVARRR
jgi:farnesyl diphosphate synthase